MNQDSLLAQFETLLPLAVAWATEQEREILRNGVSLSAEEIADACAIGVKEADRVRLLRIEVIPRPSAQSRLRRHWFSHPGNAGIDFGPRDFYSIGLLAGSIAHCPRARAHCPVWEARWHPSFSAQVSFRMSDRWIFSIAFGTGGDCCDCPRLRRV